MSEKINMDKESSLNKSKTKFSLEDIPVEISGVTLSESDRIAIANGGVSGVLKDIINKGRIVDATLSAEIDPNTNKFVFIIKPVKKELEIPEEISGKKLNSLELKTLKEGEPIVFNTKGNDLWIRIDTKSNTITIESGKDVDLKAAPESFCSYTFSELEREKLENKQTVGPRLFSSKGVFFVSEITMSKHGFTFSNVKEVSKERAEYLQKTLNANSEKQTQLIDVISKETSNSILNSNTSDVKNNLSDVLITNTDTKLLDSEILQNLKPASIVNVDKIYDVNLISQEAWKAINIDFSALSEEDKKNLVLGKYTSVLKDINIGNKKINGKVKLNNDEKGNVVFNIHQVKKDLVIPSELNKPEIRNKLENGETVQVNVGDKQFDASISKETNSVIFEKSKNDLDKLARNEAFKNTKIVPIELNKAIISDNFPKAHYLLNQGVAPSKAHLKIIDNKIKFYSSLGKTELIDQANDLKYKIEILNDKELKLNKKDLTFLEFIRDNHYSNITKMTKDGYAPGQNVVDFIEKSRDMPINTKKFVYEHTGTKPSKNHILEKHLDDQQKDKAKELENFKDPKDKKNKGNPLKNMRGMSNQAQNIIGQAFDGQ